MVLYPKMSSKGRIELHIGGSGAKDHEEPAGDVRFYVAREKPHKNSKNIMLNDGSEIFESVRKHPNASKHIRSQTKESEQLQKLPKSLRATNNLAVSLHLDFGFNFRSVCVFIFILIPFRFFCLAW